MPSYFDNYDTFGDLQRSIPYGWQVAIMSDPERHGVTFQFPTVLNAATLGIMEQIARQLFDDRPGNKIFDIGVADRFTGEDEDREVRRYVEIDIDWPMPADIINRLQHVTEVVVAACMEQEQQV